MRFAWELYCNLWGFLKNNNFMLNLERTGGSCKMYSSQAQPIDPELTAKLLGHGVAVSPVVTVEPRRRKFHKAITLSMPAPRPHSQGMINQYSGSAPTLRLLCSITGKFKQFSYLNKFSFYCVVLINSFFLCENSSCFIKCTD